MRERVQLSLIFKDVDFYYNYINPYHSNKELNPLVLRLLKAYFLSEEVQDAVDTFDQDPADIIVSDNNDSFTEALNDARRTLAFMNMLTEGAKDELENGVNRINEIAQMSGGSPAKANEFGMGMPQFGDFKQLTSGIQQNDTVQSAKSAEPSQQSVSAQDSRRMDAIETQLSSLTQLMTKLTNTVNTFITSGIAYAQPQVQPFVQEVVQPVQETPAKSNGITEQTVPVQEPVFTDSSSEDDFISEVFQTETMEYDANADAMNALNNAVNSATAEPVDTDSETEQHISPPPADFGESEDKDNREDGTASLMDFMNSGVGYSVQL